MTKNESRHYRLKVTDSVELRDGSIKVRLQTEDSYHGNKYAIERRSVVLLNSLLNGYLKKYPKLQHESSNNIAKKLVYMIPGIRAWSVYMPGGFATFHVHDPKRTQLQNGKKIDFITKAMFRHSYDGQGLRSRAYAMNWFIETNTEDSRQLRWVSIGCGTGQPTFEAFKVVGKPTKFILVDGNSEILDFAKKLAKEYDIKKEDITNVYSLDVNDPPKVFLDNLNEFSPNVVDAMGLFEYLDEKSAIKLLKRLYAVLESGGVIVFTNMLHSHPHIDLHKRGLGWPGVRQRTVSEMRHIIKSAGINAEKLTVMLPDDGVYSVYGVKK